MERNQLIYIITIAETGNITKAAEKLHLSQPSLSNQIIALEKELGIPLLERKRQRVYLTEAGRIFVEEARQIINSIDGLKNIMQEYAQEKAGNLQIGALSIMCALHIPELLHDFQTCHPGISLSLLESGSTTLLNSLSQNELDAAFVILDPMVLPLNEFTSVIFNETQNLQQNH